MEMWSVSMDVNFLTLHGRHRQCNRTRGRGSRLARIQEAAHLSSEYRVDSGKRLLMRVRAVLRTASQRHSCRGPSSTGCFSIDTNRACRTHTLSTGILGTHVSWGTNHP